MKIPAQLTTRALFPGLSNLVKTNVITIIASESQLWTRSYTDLTNKSVLNAIASLVFGETKFFFFFFLKLWSF